MNTKRESETRTGILSEDFGVKDAKGRAIGGQVTLTTVVWVESEDGWCDVRAAGTWFGYEPSATRDGRSFGAYSYGKSFTTEAERDKAVITYFKSARKRAKKAARTPVQA